MRMQTLPTRVCGPLPEGTVGLLLGRSSTTLQGILVDPGVTDVDFEGEIKVMTHSLNEIFVVKTGQRLAQLISLP